MKQLSTMITLVCCILFLIAGHLATNNLTIHMSTLPLEGTARTAKPATMTSNTKIFPLLAQIHTEDVTLNESDLDMAFTRPVAQMPMLQESTAAEKAVVVEQVTVQPKPPSQAEVFKQRARLTAIAAQGVFINGRYYQVGEAINSSIRLESVQRCTAHFRVSTGTHSSELVHLSGHC